MDKLNVARASIPVYKKLFPENLYNLIIDAFMAGPYERIEIMKKFKDSAAGNKDAEALYEVFADASGINGVPKQLLKVLDRKTNLAKLIKQNRIKRIGENFVRIGERMQLPNAETGAEYISIFVTTMVISYGKLNEMDKLNLDLFDSNSQNIRGLLILALLSEYSKGLNPYDYINMGFVLFFIKTLSVYSMIQKEILDAHPELMTYVNNILELIKRVTENLPPEYLATITPPEDNRIFIDGEEL